MEALQKRIPTPLEFAHITKLFEGGSGMLDSEWVPKIAGEGRWIVITADQGRRGSQKGGKLPRLCLEYKITHLLLSASVHALNSQAKQDAIFEKWDRISCLDQYSPGSRFKMRYRAAEGSGDAKKLCFEAVEIAT